MISLRTRALSDQADSGWSTENATRQEMRTATRLSRAAAGSGAVARRSLAAMFLAAFSALAFASSALAARDADAEAFVQRVIDEANPVFQIDDAAKRKDRVNALVDRYVDLNRVSNFALGQYARAATPAQKAVFRPAFQTHLRRLYLKILESYQGEALKVTGSVVRSPRDIVVKTAFIGAAANAPYAQSIVSWRVYRTESGAFSIMDVGVDEAFLVVAQQSQFKEIIASHGGAGPGIDALIADLEAMNAAR